MLAQETVGGLAARGLKAFSAAWLLPVARGQCRGAGLGSGRPCDSPCHGAQPIRLVPMRCPSLSACPAGSMADGFGWLTVNCFEPWDTGTTRRESDDGAGSEQQHEPQSRFTGLVLQFRFGQRPAPPARLHLSCVVRRRNDSRLPQAAEPFTPVCGSGGLVSASLDRFRSSPCRSHSAIAPPQVSTSDLRPSMAELHCHGQVSCPHRRSVDGAAAPHRWRHLGQLNE